MKQEINIKEVKKVEINIPEQNSDGPKDIEENVNRKKKTNFKIFLLLGLIFVSIIVLVLVFFNNKEKEKKSNENTKVNQKMFNEIKDSLVKELTSEAIGGIEVKKINDFFARVTVFYSLGDGDDYILKNIKGKWEIITTDGQAYPECEIVDRYQVPEDFYNGCIDSMGTLRGGKYSYIIDNKDFFSKLDEEVLKIASGTYKFKGKSTNIFSGSNKVENESYDFYWKTDEGLVVSTYLEGSDYSEFNFFNNHKIVKEFVTDEEKEEYDLLFLQEEKMKDTFEKYGFTYNDLNSMDPHGCGDKSIAFEKNDLKCLLLMRPSAEGDNSGYNRTIISIKCSDGISQAIENQREALKQLDFEGSYISGLLIDNSNFCKELSINLGGLGGCGGHGAVFIGLDNEWIKTGEGHTVSTCKDMEKKNIPQNFIDNCNISCYPDQGEIENYKDYLNKN